MMSWASISREAKKHQKKKNALVSPKQRGKKKSKFCQSTRDQGQRPAGIRPTKSDQINPNPTNSVVLGANLAESCPRCCSADFGSRIKISGHPLGRSTSFFEPDLFRPVPGFGVGPKCAPSEIQGEGGSGPPPTPPRFLGG